MSVWSQSLAQCLAPLCVPGRDLLDESRERGRGAALGFHRYFMSRDNRAGNSGQGTLEAVLPPDSIPMTEAGIHALPPSGTSQACGSHRGTFLTPRSVIPAWMGPSSSPSAVWHQTFPNKG